MRFTKREPLFLRLGSIGKVTTGKDQLEHIILKETNFEKTTNSFVYLLILPGIRFKNIRLPLSPVSEAYFKLFIIFILSVGSCSNFDWAFFTIIYVN